ncbi:IS30 family transposase [Metamycoplasma phocicerebrale]|uniref:IS30 family transposase n=1 Tax=Metamycoplasma phocicerebrale TaxID=142649 RepID=A0A3Q9VBF1_9BACT|nr:IS30 family transposase [Metamycoplasma phocicerebrale]AZZ65374.1 IS30 family transposase [Metamycoplasma phocicerebrale]
MNYKAFKKYFHISYEERFFIKKLMDNGYSIRKIARRLRRSPSTISREIKRNLDLTGNYDSCAANIKSFKRHSHKYMFRFNVNFSYKEFTNIFIQKYDKKFFGIKSTYHYIKTNFKIKLPSLRTVFNWIKSNQWTIKKHNRLRSFYKKGGKRTASVVSRLVTSASYVFPIWTRPKSVDLRQEYGHWEADLVIGKRSTGFRNILTLTERKTRIGFATFVLSKSGYEINTQLRKLIKENSLIVKSITIDNGIEFEKIGILAKWLKIKIYRAEPYASFQRGSNENWNGLIRREYKKGFNFNTINIETLQNISNKINEMPREILGWKSSKELFLKENYI